jgi:hypothetical protein
MEDSYIIYRDSTGEFGYSPIDFYKGKPELLEDVLVLYDELSEKAARKLTKSLNVRIPHVY